MEHGERRAICSMTSERAKTTTIGSRRDSVLIQRCTVGDFTCSPTCDVTNDGKWNTLNARIIQRFVVRSIPGVRSVFPAAFRAHRID